jgi:hypothetical protein
MKNKRKMYKQKGQGTPISKVNDGLKILFTTPPPLKNDGRSLSSSPLRKTRKTPPAIASSFFSSSRKRYNSNNNSNENSNHVSKRQKTNERREVYFPPLFPVVASLSSSSERNDAPSIEYIMRPYRRIDNSIKTHFEYFRNFDLLQSVEDIGVVSSNGALYKLNFEKDNIKITSLLKTSKTSHSDNLYYEYIVGTFFINRMCNIFPCFIETYDLMLKNNDDVNMREVNKYKHYIKLLMLSKNKDNFTEKMLEFVKYSCVTSSRLVIMTQYLEKYILFSEFIINLYLSTSTVQQILFQIYGPLFSICQHFTHYDLHGANVLLSELPINTFIKMKYIFKVSEVEFKSGHIVKIIDYGRSYFKLDENINSTKISEVVLDTRVCHKSKIYPRGVGYEYVKCLEPEKNFFVCSKKRNVSHDLKLLAHFANNTNVHREIRSISRRLHYSDNYGTKEINDEFNIGLEEQMKIYNVSKMVDYLLSEMITPNFRISNDNEYRGMTCIGNLSVYLDESGREMEFLPISSV